MTYAALNALAEIVSDAGLLTSASDMAPFLREPRGLFHSSALAVVRPKTTFEVAECVKIAATYDLKIMPQAGNTGLVGGQFADDAKKHLILSLDQMHSIREVDLESNTLTVDAGVTLKRVQDVATEHDRMFPLRLGSEGSCRIGGNLATNAGGINVIAYGSARQLCLGLEVVLANGEIWNGLRKLKKDNTGYDLRDLFIGSEGTLGIITGAVLKLFPKPQHQETIFAAVPSPEAAISLLNQMQDIYRADLTSFEIIADIGVDFAVQHGHAKCPLETKSPWYVLAEASLAQIPQSENATLLELLEHAMGDNIITDAAIAQSEQQRFNFWHLREVLSEAQKGAGGSIKHDISVPVNHIPAFLKDAEIAVEKTIPGARPCPFGHLGDGNLHYNVSQPIGMDKQCFLDQWDEMNDAVHHLVAKYNGSISAEHGIGTLKRDLMSEIKSDVELDLMRKIKSALDPDHRFNPGKVLP